LLSLPSTSTLKTFGYPTDVSAIKADTNVLNLFQEYNKAIARTTEVLHINSDEKKRRQLTAPFKLFPLR
jgi:hypothetical protein